MCSRFFYKNFSPNLWQCFLPSAGLWGQVYLPRCHVPSPWSIFRRKLCQSNTTQELSGVVMGMLAVLIPELVNVTAPTSVRARKSFLQGRPSKDVSGLQLSTEQI